MSASVSQFPPPPAERCQALASCAQAIANRLGDQTSPVLSAVAQLLELDDAGFADRLAQMRDPEGGALVHELGVALRHAAADLELGGRAVFLIRARLAAGIANDGGLDAR